MEVRVDEALERKESQTATVVLAVLRAGPLHGYQIAREIERRSEGYFECKEGTLYPLLHRLERAGLVQGEWRTAGEQRRRRYYALTPAGERHLAGAAAQWRLFASHLLALIEDV